jgi:hypothetical protein
MTYMHPETRNVEQHIGLTTTKHLTPAGTWLVRYRRVPSCRADYIAELAGFRTEAHHG